MNSYRSTILIAILSFSANFLFFNQNSFAQDRKTQLETQKVAFISNKLNLSVAEAQKFWPLYNEYQQKKEQIILKRREILSRIKLKTEQYSDNELTKMSDDFIQLQIDESNLAQEYHAKFKEVLTIKKVIGFYNAEEQFKVWLLKEMKNKAQNKKGNN